jgi:hypothetical protein
MSVVFVSYSRNNLEAVKQIVADLHDVGEDTWYDRELDCGKKWWNTILEEIRRCDIFIVALSPESCGSDACKKEWTYASDLGKPILPVQVADGINLNLLPPPLNERQVTDYRLRDKPATLALFKAINRTDPAPPMPDPLPKPPDVPMSYIMPLKQRIDSEQPLSPDDQSLLYLKLEEAVEEGRAQAEIRDLLVSLKKRDDLLAKVCQKVDTLLKRLDEGGFNPPGNGDGRREPHGSGELNHGAQPSKPTHCPKCGAKVGTEVVFCGACGHKVSAALPRYPEHGSDSPSRAGWKCRRYTCRQDDVQRLTADLKNWLRNESFDLQQMDTEDQGVLLQVKKRGALRDLVGMSTALNIVLKYSGDMLSVEIGAGKWVDKAVVGAVSMLVLWPLAFTAGYGAWEQSKLPDKIFEFVGARLSYS